MVNSIGKNSIYHCENEVLIPNTCNLFEFL